MEEFISRDIFVECKELIFEQSGKRQLKRGESQAILNEDQVEELKLAFDLFDSSSNGYLTKSDLKDVLDKYGTGFLSLPLTSPIAIWENLSFKLLKIRFRFEGILQGDRWDVQGGRCHQRRQDRLSRVYVNDGPQDEAGQWSHPRR